MSGRAGRRLTWRSAARAAQRQFGWPAILEELCEHAFIDVLGEAPVVLDLGANRGDFTRLILARFPRARVITVEANPDLVDHLKTLFATANVNVVHAAIGGTQRASVEFYVSEQSMASSISKDISGVHGLRGGGAPVLVPMTTIGALMDRFGLDRVDLLKMDVEGAELDVIEGLGPETGSIGQLTVEFHDFVDPTLRERSALCISKLKRGGYAMIRQPTDCLHGSPYGMCLFYRRTLRIEAHLLGRASAAFVKAPFRLARQLARRISARQES